MGRRSASQSARLDALKVLMSHLAEYSDTGEPPPCTVARNGHWWLSSDPELREAAMYACRACPALSECTQYVTKYPESSGIWASVDFDERKEG